MRLCSTLGECRLRTKKYLGMIFNRRMSMIKSSKHAAGPFMASTFWVRQFVRENSLVIGYMCLCGLGRRMCSQPVCMLARCGALNLLKKLGFLQYKWFANATREFFERHAGC